MKMPSNIVRFPERRVRRMSRPRTPAARLENGVMPTVAVGASLAIWPLVLCALWQLVAGDV